MSAAVVERLRRAADAVGRADLHRRHGRVVDLIGLIVEATGLEAEVGEVVVVQTARAHRGEAQAETIPAEVVGFRAGRTLLMPLGDMHGIGPGDPVTATGRQVDGPVGPALLGRVLDGLGRPIDGGPGLDGVPRRPIVASPPSPMGRPRIDQRVSLGVRSLDGFVPAGKGQRLGIFAGSGVGKSSLLGMIAKAAQHGDRINVICLVGERGREVREFIDRDLGPARDRSVVVVATSDQPALVRIKAALTATTIAEAFRDAGHDVMLMMDSVTRFAMAQREVGLAIGEPPATRGYTPSVFAVLPKLLERSGTSEHGSITALYTVLVDGDDFNEPIADAVRSILDGHIVLTRELAHAGHYPAVDVLQSVSRLVGEVTSPGARAVAQELRGLLAAYHEKADLIAIGAYEAGTDPKVDRAIELRGALEAFLRQSVEEDSDAASAEAAMRAITGAPEEEVSGEDALLAGLMAELVPSSAPDLGPVPAATPSAIPPLNLAV